jgi:hypothetical protein
VFDHSKDGQLLYFKERLLGPKHPNRTTMEKFSAKLRKLGIVEGMSLGPRKAEFEQLRLDQGLNENLNMLRSETA